MTLSIIIVSYNVKYFLEQCLCSVKEAIPTINAEVIVIDNGSTDGSLNYLQARFSWVQFIQNKTNDGFAKANNKALQTAKGEYILFLNPDTILAEDTLERCIFFYKNNIAVGAIGVKMIDGSGNFLPESKRSFPSPLVSFYKLMGLSFLFPKHKQFGKYSLGYLSENTIHKVDVISGAFMMIPKEVLEKSGGFDERFFMYAEDIDLSYRIQKSGYQNYFLGNVTIVHFKGESTKRGSLAYVKVFYNAMILFVKKWYRGSGAWLLRQGLQTGIVLRGFISFFGFYFTQKKQAKPASFSNIILLGNTGAARVAEDVLHSIYPEKTITQQSFQTNNLSAFNNAMVVFCTGDISYQKSIELLQNTKAVCYKWMGKNSRSMVGSNNKNNNGEEIALDKKNGAK